METRVKKYSKIINDINNQTIIDGKNVKELETILSSYNKNTCNYEKFINYITQKNKLNSLLYSHYQKVLFRKLKLNRYINTQKNETKMIKTLIRNLENLKYIMYNGRF